MKKRITKVTTKTGDKGTTGMADGSRVSKADPVISCIGEIDELNSLIGYLDSILHLKKYKATLNRIQNDLFDLGADLATPEQKKYKFTPLRITKRQVDRIEKSIDQFNKKLKALNSFVLPGGSESASFLHNARTVARRAETRIVSLSKKESINNDAIRYINRLSDLLFVLSRVENQNGKKDILWKPGKNT